MGKVFYLKFCPATGAPRIPRIASVKSWRLYRVNSRLSASDGRRMAGDYVQTIAREEYRVVLKQKFACLCILGDMAMLDLLFPTMG